MLQREFLIDQIRTSLLLWKDEIEINGKLNLLNGHVLSEDLYARILNIIYGYELTNLNTHIQNSAGTDLIDHTNKILMQVSATTTSEKRKHSVKLLDQKKYDGYTLYMVYISKISVHAKAEIKDLTYIQFDINKHIIDLTKLTRKMYEMELPQLEKLHDLVQSEITIHLPAIGNPLLSSDLVSVLSALSKNNFKDYYKKEVPLPFKIKKKIEQNHLEINEDMIIKNHMFYELMQRIYDTYDQEADNTSYAVWEKIADFGRDIMMNDHLAGDQLFTKIWKAAYDYVCQDQSLLHLSKEKIENCIKIIIVDAFMRCKIMKAPIDKEDESDAIAQ